MAGVVAVSLNLAKCVVCAVPTSTECNIGFISVTVAEPGYICSFSFDGSCVWMAEGQQESSADILRALISVRLVSSVSGNMGNWRCVRPGHPSSPALLPTTRLAGTDRGHVSDADDGQRGILRLISTSHERPLADAAPPQPAYAQAAAATSRRQAPRPRLCRPSTDAPCPERAASTAARQAAEDD